MPIPVLDLRFEVPEVSPLPQELKLLIEDFDFGFEFLKITSPPPHKEDPIMDSECGSVDTRVHILGCCFNFQFNDSITYPIFSCIGIQPFRKMMSCFSEKKFPIGIEDSERTKRFCDIN